MRNARLFKLIVELHMMWVKEGANENDPWLRWLKGFIALYNERTGLDFRNVYARRMHLR
jgi:hypothetical protein